MDKEMKGDCPMCQKGWMGSGMCGQHHWMHIIIKIAVALLIFWCGVQFGELKSAVRNAYSYYGGGFGYGMMSGYAGNRAQTYYVSGPGMMGNWAYTAVSGATTTKK